MSRSAGMRVRYAAGLVVAVEHLDASGRVVAVQDLTTSTARRPAGMTAGESSQRGGPQMGAKNRMDGLEATGRVNAAVAAGRVPDHPMVRAAWADAFQADSVATAAQLDAMPARPRPGSLNRALAASALPARPDVQRPAPVIAAAPTRAAVSPVAADRALAAADGGAARQGRITGDEVRRRDAVVAAAVAAGKIPHQCAAGWRTRLDGNTAATERALSAASASQPAVPSGSLQRSLGGVPNHVPVAEPPSSSSLDRVMMLVPNGRRGAA